MSKVNRYRAWTIKKKIMCYNNEDGNNDCWDGVFSSEVGLINQYLNLPEHLKSYEYMQYIGIIDKNGKEVYEGDVVKIHQFLFDGCEYEEEIIVSIEYMEDMACFGANLLHAKEIRKYMGYDSEMDKEEKVVVPLCDFYGMHEESFEIIGNVYENTDLLKEAGNE